MLNLIFAYKLDYNSYNLPHNPPLVLNDDLRKNIDTALVYLGRLNAILSLLPYFFVYVYTKRGSFIITN